MKGAWRSRIATAIGNPVYALRCVARDLVGADERELARLTGTSRSEIDRWLAEPLQGDGFRQHLEECRGRFADLEGIGATPLGKSVRLQYALIRAVRPEVLVETGVANGFSTAYALRALDRNSCGRLYSIDIDHREFVPHGEEVGWVVPTRLRERWDLHLGDARDLLPPLLDELGRIDVFVHDSLHTYEHMRFEYETACPHLRPGGYLVSDDVLWNDAFPEFATSVPRAEHAVLRGVGFLRMPENPSGGAEDHDRD